VTHDQVPPESFFHKREEPGNELETYLQSMYRSCPNAVPIKFDDEELRLLGIKNVGF
jgi:hypothetical protein